MNEFNKLSPEDTRKHKGKSFVGVTTTAICHDGNGRYFFNKRGQNARDERGTWDFCGGGLKVGFTVEENCVREVQEEYGTTPLELTPIGYREIFRTDHDGHDTHWISIDFLVRIDPEEAKRNEPEIADEVGWYRLNELPEPRHSQFDIVIAKYRDILK